MVENEKFDRTIRNYLSFDVPVVSVSDLKNMDNVVILDAREWEEYDISHIQGARFVGFSDAKFDVLQDLPKDTTIVVYCSIGYRSEKVGEKLMEEGFTNVSNLYGSIFEWVNRGYPVVDNRGDRTDTLHAYDRKWSRWVNGDSITKVW